MSLLENPLLKKLANFINHRFRLVYVQNKKNFILKLSEMVEKMNADVGRQLLVWEIEKSTISEKSIGNIFFIIKNISSISPSIFIVTTIPQILKAKLYALCT